MSENQRDRERHLLLAASSPAEVEELLRLRHRPCLAAQVTIFSRLGGRQAAAELRRHAEALELADDATAGHGWGEPTRPWPEDRPSVARAMRWAADRLEAWGGEPVESKYVEHATTQQKAARDRAYVARFKAPVERKRRRLQDA